jgi:protein-disulfide isomerase
MATTPLTVTLNDKERRPLPNPTAVFSDRKALFRRDVLKLVVGAAALGLAGPQGALAQRKKGPAEVSVAELMKPGPLPELALGDPQAPITVVEYASMTCGHCAHFHNTVFPQLKEKYIDTGKVHFIMREFPLDNLAVAASMLARCSGGDKTFPLISALFAKQDDWAFVRGDPRPELLKFAKQAGFTKESFDKCLTDQKLLDEVVAVRTRASEVFGVDATPTFFINGRRLSGVSLEDFEKAFAPILKS